MEVKEFSFKASLSREDRALLVQEVMEALLPYLTATPDNGITNAEECPLSKKEICRFLSCSEPTMTKWMAEGRIPFSRKGRRVYFLKSEVLASLKQPQRKAGR